MSHIFVSRSVPPIKVCSFIFGTDHYRLFFQFQPQWALIRTRPSLSAQKVDIISIDQKHAARIILSQSWLQPCEWGQDLGKDGVFSAELEEKRLRYRRTGYFDGILTASSSLLIRCLAMVVPVFSAKLSLQIWHSQFLP